MNSAHRKSQGFTLLEVLLVVAVLMVVLGAVFLLVTQNQRTYQIQQSQIEAGQNARLAAERIGRELLSAGYNTPAGLTPIAQADASTIAFSGDTNDDGTSERVTFSYANNVITRTTQPLDANGNLTGTATSQQLASNISALTFAYFVSAADAGSFVSNPASHETSPIARLLRRWGFITMAAQNSNSNSNSNSSNGNANSNSNSNSNSNGNANSNSNSNSNSNGNANSNANGNANSNGNGGGSGGSGGTGGTGQSSVPTGSLGNITRINLAVTSFATQNHPVTGDQITVTLRARSRITSQNHTR